MIVFLQSACVAKLKLLYKSAVTAPRCPVRCGIIAFCETATVLKCWKVNIDMDESFCAKETFFHYTMKDGLIFNFKTRLTHSLLSSKKDYVLALENDHIGTLCYPSATMQELQ